MLRALILASLCLLPLTTWPQETAPLQTNWTAGSGKWTDAQRWSHGLPTGYQSVSIRGNSHVVIPPGAWLAADLRVGVNRGDHSQVEIDGGQLVLMQDSLFVGEYSGGEAEVILKAGAVHSVMD